MVEESGEFRISLVPPDCTPPSLAMLVLVVVVMLVIVVAIFEMNAVVGVIDWPVWAVVCVTVELRVVVTSGGPGMKKQERSSQVISVFFSTVSL